ncbi:Eco57I restriction-modification methylase domain-containing protein [Nordella sp. HKS 07]|uniref:Eco57I restriction-modification methylase domain-containing protein n=1 Tax=Nordella sp. HKS 07 TaxID=2712222 RepID=UPI0019D088EA|nr:type IIL restriction-modification enzyme MmeI [Nordella sp. HKS 07]
MSNDHEWLNLVEVSGPFLAVPILRDVFPQGLEVLPSGRSQRLRRTYEEWRDAVDMDDVDLAALHAAWIDDVLLTALEMDDTVLRKGSTLAARLTVSMPEHGVTVAPDIAVVNPTNGDEPLLLIHVYDPDTDLDATRRFDGLAITPADRMVWLLRATGCPIGILTNGERWMLVHAPVGAVAGFASWYARLWGQELETLRAFVSLLGVRRFFGPDEGKLPALYERSLKHQDDVTEALGEQVRRAVEVLVQALDRADQDRNRDLLRDVDPRELYEAGLTMMMRLVFLLAAEERALLLLGDPRYDAFYAISSLRTQLRADSEEILERRRSAWSRLLALFRGVYGGIDHPMLRLPALGGSLFDPDRYPFLEGRKKGTSWRSDPAEPLPIDDRTVLLLLEAIQTFEGHTLSYRALDVEQIGHVYEGLLERTVKRVDDVTLELDSGAKAKSPRVTLGEMDSARLDGAARIAELLKERSERSESAIRNALERTTDDRLTGRLLTICRGDIGLRDRILPYAPLLRTDPWGYPLVHHEGAFVVVLGADRRESGTHYTPKSLTEKIVEETLTPVAYRGPAEGKAPDEWELKSACELLDLKFCDPTMGSGAFLVQTCRWLSDRLVEAWSVTEASGKRIDSEGRLLDEGDGVAFEPLSQDAEERAILARRLIAERCLYGVDRNPLAVELAKLSLWLTTMSKGRPFGFLDHNLRSGDSLLGIHDLGQLVELDMNPKGKAQLRLFGRTIRSAVDQALGLRARLREIPIRDIHDVEAMAALNAQSRGELELPTRVADAFVGIILAEERAGERAARIQTLAAFADAAASGDTPAKVRLLQDALNDLAKDVSDGVARQPFHWPLEFPEVFLRENGGFDAFVGNPPFLGGQRITGAMGTAFRNWLVDQIAQGRRGSADLVAYFFLRTFTLMRERGHLGFLAVNTIAEGDTRQVGLESMLKSGAVIHAAYPNEPWPGAAAVVTSRVHILKGIWNAARSLLGRPARYISPFLSDREEWSPKKLKANEGIAFQGSIVLGMGFVLTPDDAQRMLDADPRNADVIFPYLNGEDLNSDSEQRPSRWVINFWDWPEDRARKYPLPYVWLEDHVKEERLVKNDRVAREKWWLPLRARPELYHAIGRGHLFEKHPDDWNRDRPTPDRVLVCSEVTKHLAFALVPNQFVFSANLDIFSDINLFCVLQSSIHEIWARQYCSRLETRLKYSPGNAFETFPFPTEIPTRLLSLGEQLEKSRLDFMTMNSCGLTGFYNHFHRPDSADDAIIELRGIQRQIDRSLADSYGWDDLDLGHGFHEVSYLLENDRVRFTISGTARREVLGRLAELNRQRYQEEVEQGLHEGRPGSGKARGRRSRVVSASESTLDLEDTRPTTFERGA